MTLEDYFISGFIKAGTAMIPKLSTPASPSTAATPPSQASQASAAPKPSLVAAPPIPASSTPKPSVPAPGSMASPQASPNAGAMNGWKLVGQTGDASSMSKIYRDQQGGYHHITEGAQNYDQLKPASQPAAQPKFNDSDEIAEFNRVAAMPSSPGDLGSYGVKPTAPTSPGADGFNKAVNSTVPNLKNDPYASAVIERTSPAMYGGQPVPNIPLPEMESNFDINSRAAQNKKEMDQIDPHHFHTSTDPGIRNNEMRDLVHLFNLMSKTKPEMARSMHDRYLGTPQPAGPSF